MGVNQARRAKHLTTMTTMNQSQKPAFELRLLGLDIGTKRIGLATWNPEARLSTPIEVRIRKTLKEDLKFFKHVLEVRQIEAFVLGVPYNLEGNQTQSTKNALFWVQCLKENFLLPVFECDEALSTKEALSLLRQSGVKNKKEKVDSLAAALILDEFIRRAHE